MSLFEDWEIHVTPFAEYRNTLFFSHPGYFGKVGMRYFHKTLNKFFCPSVNVEKLWSLVSEKTRENYKDNKDKAPVIDVVRAVSIPRVFIHTSCIYTITHHLHNYIKTYDFYDTTGLLHPFLAHRVGSRGGALCYTPGVGVQTWI